MKNYLNILFLGLIALSSCTEEIEFNIKEADKKVVIEAIITDLPGPDTIKVSQTNSFYSKEAPPTVDDAIVVITDNHGVTETLQSIGNGRYLTNTIKGKAGNIYNISVKAKGKTFEASSAMPPVTKFDSIYFNYYDKRSILHDSGYYMAMVTTEPKATKDFYMWKYYRNGVLLNGPDDFWIADDQFTQSSINGFEGPYVFFKGDTARVEMYSLTEAAYKFYISLENNLNNEGGFFGSPASNPPTNFSNMPLGIFQASSVEVAEAIVK